MPPAPGTYQLSAQALSQMKVELAQNNYAAAYRVVLADLQNQAANGIVIDKDTMTWYTDAPEINDTTSTAAIHYFVRDYVSDYVDLKTGQPISDIKFQDASDKLAQQILGGIATSGGTIQPFEEVGIKDTKNITQQFDVDKFAWPAYAELAAVSDPNFENHSFLEGIPLADQVNILTTTNAAGMQTLGQLLGNGQIGNAFNFISPQDELFIQERLPTLLDQIFYQNLLSPASETHSLLELEGTPLGADALSLDSMIGSFASNSLTTTQQNSFLQTLHDFQDQTAGYYIVNSGDSWNSIATNYGISGATLQAINADISLSGLTVGGIIQVPISEINGLPSAANLNPLTNQTGIYDITTGKWIITNSTFDELNDGTLSIIDDSGHHLGEFTSAPSNFSMFGNNLQVVIDSAGDKLLFAPNDTATLENTSGQSLVNYGVGQLWSIAPGFSGSTILDTLISGNIIGNLLNSYSLNAATGTLTNLGAEFDASTSISSTPLTIAQYIAATSSLQTNANNLIGLDAATGSTINTLLPVLSVTQLGSSLGGSNNSSELTGSVLNGSVIWLADALVETGPNSFGTNSIANTDGLFTNALTNTVTGDYRTGNDELQAPEDIIGDLVSGIFDPTFGGAVQSLASFLGLSGLVAAAPSLLNTDPLLIDLTGQGIRVTNWINSPAYFDTNVGANGQRAINNV